MSYDFESSRTRYMNTNVIDHRPSLLVSSRQLSNRSPSPTFAPSQKIPMKAIYRSLTQNSPQFNIEKLIDKYRALDVEAEDSHSYSSSNNLTHLKSPRILTLERKTGAISRNVAKTTPSIYRQKNCGGCSPKKQDIDLKIAEDETPKIHKSRNGNESTTNSSIKSARSYSSYCQDNPTSWRFDRQNSFASSYYSTDQESTTSRASYVKKTSLGSNSSARTAASTIYDPSINLSTDHKTKKPSSRIHCRAPAKPKPMHLKNIFVVNGSVISFSGHGFESFTNWFGDETMLSSSEKDNKTKLRSVLHKEFDMSGFTNQEINMKLYDGNKLIIEASRSMRGRYPAMRFKETIQLPKSLNVESLIICN